MTKDEAIARIKADCHSGDIEADHGTADLILCEFLTALGHQDLVDVWDEVDKWYA